ncbi:PP1-complex regulatory subunit GLC8 ASCRUDRAFT_109284 [Ascoidea rubescens DSM 1968]|uniref:Protein phosphatase inhibitor 2 n=1 Tax=Ascoidea rubescens DSM 1968 TaxID=1344418 RepID=A0A1D2VCU8_9ASCO|nr:hypothetical protein ASCRUDRAFT_109284 [Ascoidea rubescens DSM 1968]ODV59518.1 hypothetical protein ASCRUDRAFT_109284 [Ascoidea rubescens DSM 1968]
MSEKQPRSILRNAPDLYKENILSNYNRQIVLENTKKNALLNDKQSEGNKIRKQILLKKQKALQDDDSLEKVQFNQKNLEENDKIKASMTFTKIDEPKTPYQGAVDPSNDYYRTDNETDSITDDGVFSENEATVDDISNFSLGEPEVDSNPIKMESLNGGTLIRCDSDTDPYAGLTPEQAKRKRFEEMRKKHYHNEVVPFKHFEPDDDEDERN